MNMLWTRFSRSHGIIFPSSITTQDLSVKLTERHEPSCVCVNGQAYYQRIILIHKEFITFLVVVLVVFSECGVH